MVKTNKKAKKQVKVEDLAPKQDPKGGGVIMEDRPAPTTTLTVSNTTLTSANTWTGKS